MAMPTPRNRILLLCAAATLTQACGTASQVPVEPAVAVQSPAELAGWSGAATPADVAASASVVASMAAIVAPEDDRPVLGLPERQPNALTGSEFMRQTSALPIDERERLIEAEIMRGNVPSFLRRLQPVSLASKRSPNHGEADAMQPRAHEATIWVMPDYFAIGSDTDFVRMPMTVLTATRIAKALGLILPTTKVVDAIHQQAAARVTPRPLAPSPEMTKNSYYLRHHELVEADFGSYVPGSILSGHKKEVVVATKRRSRPGSVGLYGWLQADGQPIQRLSDAHDDGYVDYAQGVRLVSSVIRLANGAEISYLDAIRSGETAALLTDEGPTARYGGFTSDTRLAAVGGRSH